MKLAYLLVAAVAIAALIGFAVEGNERASAPLAAEPPTTSAAHPAIDTAHETLHALPPGHPEIGTTPRPAATTKEEPGPVSDVAPARGENAKRIAEVYRDRESLAGKRVRVRGQVVKTMSGILGMSYSHLRDGSGNAESGDHDLTVTTRAELHKGSIVTLEGKLEQNVELGSGYRYDVLLTDAEIVPE